MSEADSRTIPLAVSTPTPGTVVTAANIFRPLITDPFGALWHAISDPATGAAVGAHLMSDPNLVATDTRGLITASGIFGSRQGQEGSVDLRVCDSIRVNGDGSFGGIADPVPDMIGLSVTAALMLTDPATGTFKLGTGFLPNGAAVQAVGYVQGVLSHTYGINLQTGQWNAAPIFGNDNDGFNPLQIAGMGVVNYAQVFDGLQWDRVRSASATTLGTQSSVGAQLSARPGEWSEFAVPAANTLATVTRLATADGTRHVCTSIVARIMDPSSLISGTFEVQLIDGATVLWSTRVMLLASAVNITGLPLDRIELTGLNIPGSPDTDMTLAFVTAGGAGTFETVSMTGYDAPA